MNVEIKKNQFSNIRKAIDIGNPFWNETERAGLSNLTASNLGDGRLRTDAGHTFINMCSYSYLGLDSHPALLQGAIDAIASSGTLNSSISRVRIQLPLLRQAEQALSSLFEVDALTTVSCAAAVSAVLPLIASGLFTEGIPPLMVFDKHAHFCINLMKPVCADETRVVSSPHNDLNFIEDMCKKSPKTAYVADGVYSTGGRAPVKELLDLQQRYGLFLFFDEAHGLSAYGENGRGYVLAEMGAINSRTIIVSSLNKGFGAAGGVIFLGPDQHRAIVTRYGGPLSWSQRINTAGLGAILASAALHRDAEFAALQATLRDNIAYFDSLLPTDNSGDGLPIRLVPVKDERTAISSAQELMREGFYTSPLFFPIVPKNKAGLRIMLRANLGRHDIKRFCDLIAALALQP